MTFLRITDLCRELRKNETPSEKLLWTELRNQNFYGYKFRRQHPFTYQTVQHKPSFFIADFYCSEKNLIIELDGRVHDFQKHYDAHRDAVLAELGLKTLRFTNDDLAQNMDTVLKRIEEALKA